MSTTHDLRGANTSALLQALVRQGRMARHELADLTGLTRASVTNLVQTLLAAGIVQETATGQSSRQGGRKPIFLELRPNAFAVLGLDLRREKVSGCLVSPTGQILKRSSKALTIGAALETVWDKFDLVVRSLMDNVDIPIIGIGLGSVGPLSKPIDFDAIQGVDVRAELEARYRLPVTVEAGTTAAAIGEQFWSPKQPSPLRLLAFVEVDYRIGTGIVSDSALTLAKPGTSVGHTTINFTGPHCHCGRRGCLDVYASGKVLLERLSGHVVEAGCKLDLAYLANLAEAGNTTVRDTIMQFGEPFANALLNMDWLLYPDSIVIGSSHDKLNDWYLRSVQHFLKTTHFSYPPESLLDRLRLAKHGSFAIAYGAATILLKSFFEVPQPLISQLTARTTTRKEMSLEPLAHL